MRIKSTTAFSAFANKRRNELAQRAKALGFLVRRLNKDGSVTKMALTETDWLYNAFSDKEAAELRRQNLESMNPGSKYTIIEV
jgi:hypothetical protein